MNFFKFLKSADRNTFCEFFLAPRPVSGINSYPVELPKLKGGDFTGISSTYYMWYCE
jgi:hypothetical protein